MPVVAGFPDPDPVPVVEAEAFSFVAGAGFADFESADVVSEDFVSEEVDSPEDLPAAPAAALSRSGFARESLR